MARNDNNGAGAHEPGLATLGGARRWPAWLAAAMAWCALLVIANSAAAKAPAGRFSVNTDAAGDVVLDATFKRTWQRVTAPGTYQWATAKTYCQGLSLQGGGWRLPDIGELESLVDFNVASPAIDTAFFPDTVTEYYWSATPSQSSPPTTAWGVNFLNGYTDHNVITFAYRVRCVR